MKENELRRLFPNASRSTLEVNSALSHASFKRNEKAALGGPIPGKEKSVGRIVVRFTGYRVRPLDPDGFAGSIKDLLDGIRHAHLLPSDDFWTIRLEAEQVQVASFAEEKTEVEIIWP